MVVWFTKKEYMGDKYPRGYSGTSAAEKRRDAAAKKQVWLGKISKRKSK